jgi:1-deoxy-D-xylulose-5-phosphate synthase
VAGGLLEQARQAREALVADGVTTDIYTLRFIKPFDADHFLRIATGYRAIVLVEDGARSGGVGEHAAAVLADNGPRFEHLGAPDIFLAQAGRDELIATAGLDAFAIQAAVNRGLETSGALKIVSAV